MENKYLKYNGVKISIPIKYQDKIYSISKDKSGYFILLNSGYEMKYCGSSQYYDSGFYFDTKKELLDMLKTIRKCEQRDFWDKGYHTLWLKKYNNKPYLDTVVGYKSNKDTWKVLISGFFHDVADANLEIIGE